MLLEDPIKSVDHNIAREIIANLKKYTNDSTILMSINNITLLTEDSLVCYVENSVVVYTGILGTIPQKIREKLMLRLKKVLPQLEVNIAELLTLASQRN